MSNRHSKPGCHSQKIPRGESAGKETLCTGNELTAQKAAELAGWAFDSLLGWMIHPEGVALIAADGRKVVIPLARIEEMDKEEA